MRKSIIPAVLIASFLAGSAAGQKKYQRPPVKTPDEFRRAAAVSPADANSIGELKWFEVFHNEELRC